MVSQIPHRVLQEIGLDFGNEVGNGQGTFEGFRMAKREKN